MNLKQLFAGTVASIENGVDWFKEKLTLSLKLDDPLTIQPYIGYGTPAHMIIRGRVLEDEGNHPSASDDPIWRNILAAYKFLESDEVAHAVVEATCMGMTQTAVSGEEGYFTFEFDLPQDLAPKQTHVPVSFKLLEAPRLIQEPVTAFGEIIVAKQSADYGVVSDIDDTVLQSSAATPIEAIKWLFLYNATTRLPFDGVASLYQALAQGENPIFYVSSSPWNLYPMLIDFFKNQNIPIGPLFLKDYGISKDQLFTSGHANHKLTQIKTIFEAHPDLSFILVGDSGQKDPEIYQEAVNLYPGRVLAIYIRDVSEGDRDESVDQIATAVKEKGVDMLLVPDSAAAAAHAVSQGWITSNWVNA